MAIQKETAVGSGKRAKYEPSKKAQSGRGQATKHETRPIRPWARPRRFQARPWWFWISLHGSRLGICGGALRVRLPPSQLPF